MCQPEPSLKIAAGIFEVQLGTQKPEASWDNMRNCKKMELYE